jgi:hypothetical protein
VIELIKSMQRRNVPMTQANYLGAMLTSKEVMEASPELMADLPLLPAKSVKPKPLVP